MTAAFDAPGGSAQRFTDALSGPDGTADPAALMPLLDVYPDALSAPMPDVKLSVMPPVALAPAASGGATGWQPTVPPARSGSARRGTTPRPALAQRGPQQVPRSAASRVTTAFNAIGTGPYGAINPHLPSPRQPVAVPVARSTAARPATSRPIFQPSRPQPTGSGAPRAVAPAAPMTSRYGRPMALNSATARSRRAMPPRRKSSSAWAVIVFFVVIAFASGLGQKVIELINELFNR